MPIDEEVKKKILGLASKFESEYSEEKISNLIGRVIHTIESVKKRSVKIKWELSLVEQAEKLTEYIKSSFIPEEMRIRCYAALRYFEENLDAIKDDDGMVGYLDDAIVVEDIYTDIVAHLKNPR